MSHFKGKKQYSSLLTHQKKTQQKHLGWQDEGDFDFYFLIIFHLSRSFYNKYITFILIKNTRYTFLHLTCCPQRGHWSAELLPTPRPESSDCGHQCGCGSDPVPSADEHIIVARFISTANNAVRIISVCPPFLTHVRYIYRCGVTGQRANLIENSQLPSPVWVPVYAHPGGS